MSELDKIDDGSPHGGSRPANPDASGATRVRVPPVMKTGAAWRFIPREETQRQGSSGRANIHVERPVELTTLGYDPRDPRSVGAAPTTLSHDPRDSRSIGAVDSREESPAFVVLTRLKTTGAEPWMLEWVYRRGRRGVPTDQSIYNQVVLLAHYGDALAPRLAHYIVHTNTQIARAMASRRQAQAASLSIVRRR